MQTTLYTEILKQKAIELLDAVIDSANRKNRTTEMDIVKLKPDLYLSATEIHGAMMFNLVDGVGNFPPDFSVNWRNFQHIKQELGL